MHKQNFWGYLFIMPFLIGLLIFTAYPFVYSFYLTFTDWDMFNPPKWIGLNNWSFTLKQEQFWYSVRNVFYFALIFVPLQAFIALIIAYVLNQSIRAKGFFRAVYFLPVITPWVAGGLLWKWLLDSKFGLVNTLLGEMGIGPFQYLDHPYWWIVIGILAVVSVWKGMGSAMIILLAGMQSISKDLLEAAEIDGATRWKKFSRIVFPLVSPMVFLVLITSSIASFQAFDVFLVMLDSPNIVKDELLTTNILIYRDAFLLFKMGSASAMSWTLFLFILIITLFQKQFEKRWVHYD
ncbi:carbohydrate ABC transporter permease [Paenibacillus eucommiae]|uniref:Multiple sugar transport system permease protein n=1 Tax=Paenibacillus eucommiae TaxID=1355755 RepID=A0ABS4J407_9BACL|nr:sugar ABC transporter permease [Paenibacillus eucommiae]MBP1994572.1 multiple sugar transport system permease protein [Paenibacillus eucommiae]